MRDCRACLRHVRGEESVCPFCSSELEVAAPKAPVMRASRAAMFLGATLGLAACKDPNTTVAPTPSATPSEVTTPIAMPAYGAVPPPSNVVAPNTDVPDAAPSANTKPAPSASTKPATSKPTTTTTAPTHQAPASAYGAVPGPGGPMQ